MRVVSLGGHVHGQDLQTVASDFLTFAHALRRHHPRTFRPAGSVNHPDLVWRKFESYQPKKHSDD